MKLQLTKKRLDQLGTLLGLIAGVSGVLGTNEIINPKVAGSISGIATVLLGYVVQRPSNDL